VRRTNSSKVYEKTYEYDKEFYVKRFYGYYLEPKLKKIEKVVDGKLNTVSYSDYEDLERFEDEKNIINITKMDYSKV